MAAKKQDCNDDLSLIARFVNSDCFNPRIKLSELESVFPPEKIERLVELGIVTKKVVEPTTCESCGSTEINVQKTENKFFIRCENCGKLFTPKIDDCIYVEVSYGSIAEKFLTALCAEEINVEKEEAYVKGSFIISHTPMKFVFIPLEMRERDLLPLLWSTTLETSRTLFFVRDENLGNILNTSIPLAIGGLALIVPLSQFNVYEIKKWISVTSKTQELEKLVLSKIDDEKLKKLVISVNTNPKYALTLLTHLKVLKSLKPKDFDWTFLENLTAIVLSYIYSSNISVGGYKNIGKAVPDNVFLITGVHEENVPEIIGFVDCKSSQVTDLRKELTEKHINYFERARKVAFLRLLKKVLVFVVFDINEKSVIDFYKRIESNLKENEYVLVFPIDALILILEIYLNLIIKSEVQLKEESGTIETFLRNIFDIGYLRSLKEKYREKNDDIVPYSKLFRISADEIISELRNILSSSSSLEDMFRRYFESAQ